MSENKETKELNQEEMERTAGGTFNANHHTDSEYANVGIRVVKHTILCDEFWWKGSDIGHYDANWVMKFYKETGRIPNSVKEAYDRFHPGGCDLVHLG